MSLRISRTACAVGMVTALALGSMPAVAQQTGTTTDTTRAAADTGRARTSVTSTRRIPVRKDAAITTTSTTSTGTVGADTTPTMDTTRTDTTGMMGADTTRRDTTGMGTVGMDTTRRDTTMSISTTATDTATVTTTTVSTTTTETTTSDVLGRGMFGNGFYIGIGGGATMPQGDFRDAYGTSWNVTVPIGWQSMTTPWGVRLDLGYNQVNGKTFAEGTSAEVELDDGTIWSALLGLTAQWPVGASGTSFYLVGGGGIHHFRDFGGFSSNGGETGGGLFGGDEENITKFGVNGGAGINFGIGAADLFVEARYVSVFTENENTNYIPVVIGLRFF